MCLKSAHVEMLARYILFSKHIRADRTIKPDAFVPHPRAELSVTRHLMTADDELWSVGHDIAREINALFVWSW